MAEELIELRGDTARCLQAGVEDSQRTVSLQALLDWLAQRATESSGYETPLLPPGTRLVKQRGRKTAVVVEQPPQVRTVEWINDGEDPSLAPDAFVARRFAFPYLVFVLSFDEGELDGYQQLYYRAAPLDGLDAPLLQANLLNVTIGGDSPANWLCLGRQPVAELEWPARVETALRSFWATPFNLDFEAPRGSGFTRLRSLDPRVSSAAAWESASAEDPLFPLAIEWPPARLTLGEAVEETLRTAARPPYPASLAELVDVFYRLPAC